MNGIDDILYKWDVHIDSIDGVPPRSHLFQLFHLFILVFKYHGWIQWVAKAMHISSPFFLKFHQTPWVYTMVLPKSWAPWVIQWKQWVFIYFQLDQIFVYFFTLLLIWKVRKQTKRQIEKHFFKSRANWIIELMEVKKII